MRKIIITSFLILSMSSTALGQVIELEKQGRSYIIAGAINGLELDFVLDTGADNISISLSMAMYMIQNGYIDEREILGTEYYRLANGALIEGSSIILRKVEIGGFALRNIEASIIHEVDAPLLMGQSALEKLGMISIDYANNLLIIGERTTESHSLEVETANDFYVRGLTKYDLGDFNGATQDFSQAINLDPSFPKAFNGRGISKLAIKDYNGALQDLNRAIELSPEFSEAHHNRGLVKGKLGDKIGEIQDINKALLFNPQNDIALMSRGYLKYTENNYDEALIDINKSIDLNPEFSQAYAVKGLVKKSLNDFKGAMMNFNKSIDLNPNYASAYNFRGSLKQDLDDHFGAIRDFNQAINLNLEYSDAYYLRAWSKALLLNIYDACLDWSKAGELGEMRAYDEIKEFCN